MISSVPVKANSKSENAPPSDMADRTRTEIVTTSGLCTHSWSYNLLLRSIAEQLVEKGLASVVRHRRDDEDRSPDYDKLMAAEQTYVASTIPLNLVNSSCSALTETRGIHSGKEQPPPKQSHNVSEVGCSMIKHIVASFELAV